MACSYYGSTSCTLPTYVCRQCRESNSLGPRWQNIDIVRWESFRSVVAAYLPGQDITIDDFMTTDDFLDSPPLRLKLKLVKASVTTVFQTTDNANQVT
jgi:hypothetical protein